MYYHNSETKESTWTIPKEYEELKGRILLLHKRRFKVAF